MPWFLPETRLPTDVTGAVEKIGDFSEQSLRTVPQGRRDLQSPGYQDCEFSPLSVSILQDPSSWLLIHLSQESLWALWLWSSLPGDHIPHCLGIVN